MSKYTMEIPIAGVPEQVEVLDLDLDKLVLDEENPRIGFALDNLSRVKNNPSQGDLAQFIKTGNMAEYNNLKRSIETNSGVMTPIWVYPIDKKKYKIIDGNTRVLIYRDLHSKYGHKFNKIKSRVLPPKPSEKVINFIRLIAHLRGVNDWQAYERARMLYLLWEKGYTEDQLKNSTKLTKTEINRWRAAYQCMTEQFLSNYSHKVDALQKFSYFVEYENKKIKDGMKRNGLTDKDFSDWVGTDEITRAQDVRDLRKMFENDRICKVLKDEGFIAAKEELSLVVPAYGSKLFEHIEKVLIGLKNMTREQEQEILLGQDSVKKDKIMELHGEVSSFISMIKMFDKGK